MYGVTWSPDGTRIVSGRIDGTVQKWNASTGKYLLTFRSDAIAVAWSPDGSDIASGGHDGNVKVWQAA